MVDRLLARLKSRVGTARMRPPREGGLIRGSAVNWLDILVLAAIAFGALYGFNKGLIRLLFALLGTVAGVILAGQHYQDLAQVLAFLPNPAIANLAAYFVIFIAVLFIT